MTNSNTVPSPPSSRARSKRKRTLLLAGVVTLTPIAYLVVRSKYLLNRTAELIAISDRFPRNYFVGDPAHVVLVYAALGDSTAAGVGAQSLEQTYPYLVAQDLAQRNHRYVHVINVAKSGAKVADAGDQYTQLGNFKPDIATLTIGANDATHLTENSDFKQNLETLLEKLSNEKGVKQCLVAAAPNMAYAPAIQPIYNRVVSNKSAELNLLIQSAAKQHNFAYVDLYNQGKLDYSSDPNLYAADQFHPSAKGYALWAKLFIAKL